MLLAAVIACFLVHNQYGSDTNTCTEYIKHILSYFILQSISPGLVKTEFQIRLKKRDDVEAAMKEYDTMNSYGPVSESRESRACFVREGRVEHAL